MKKIFSILFLILTLSFLNSSQVDAGPLCQAASNIRICDCSDSCSPENDFTSKDCNASAGYTCCCASVPTSTPTPGGSGGGGWSGGGIDFSVIKVPGFNSKFTDIGSIVSLLLPWVFGLAGIILLLMLIAGGFQLMVSAGDPKAAASAKGKLTGALIGFLIIFCAYWITQIMEKILGLNTGLF